MAEIPRRNVLFLDQSGAMGGAELSLLDIARLRAEKQHRDHIVLLSEGPFAARLQTAGVSTEVLPLSINVEKQSSIGHQLSALPRVLRLASQIAEQACQNDVIYANTQKAAIIGAVAAKMARRPLIWHLRDLLDAEHFSQANRRVVIAATNFAAKRIIANSEATANAYRQAGGRVPVTVIHNGINPAPFASIAETDVHRFRESLALPSEAKLVGVFGRLTPWKGQHLLLEALETDALKNVHTIIVGDALFTDEDRAYAKRLKEQSTAAPLAGRIHWLGQRDDVPLLMQACDMVVHCSTQPEPFGRVIVEGMLAGRPVIASAAGGALEIIDHERTGLLTELGSAKSLREAIRQIIENPSEAEHLAKTGRAEARQRFDLHERVGDINRVVEEVVR